MQAQAFANAVLKKEAPRVSGEDGVRALEVALKIGGLVRERLARFG